VHSTPARRAAPNRLAQASNAPVAGRGGRERLAAQQHTQRVDHRCSVQILMGINTKNDLGSVVLVVVNGLGHAGHGSSVS
jgi:hypothetical protein